MNKLLVVLLAMTLTGCAHYKAETVKEACQQRALRDTNDPAFVYQSCIEQGNHMLGDYWFTSSIQKCHTDTECEKAWNETYELFNQ